jgi:hypothetical protein
VRKTTLMAATEAAAPAASSDSTGPRNPTESSLSLSYADGGTYQAAGALVFVGGDLAASTFATAFPDSVGGYVISSFQQTGGDEGDAHGHPVQARLLWERLATSLLDPPRQGPLDGPSQLMLLHVLERLGRDEDARRLLRGLRAPDSLAFLEHSGVLAARSGDRGGAETALASSRVLRDHRPMGDA